MNATHQSLGGFEERLLAELRRVVVDSPSPAAVHTTPVWRPAPRWRRRPLALALGLAAAVATASVAGLALDGGESAAWAVTRNADGTVTVSINSLSDADGLERKLAAAGVPALVQYLPAGKTCAAAPGTPAALPPASGGAGAVTDERGLSQAGPAASDHRLDQSGAPPADSRRGAAVMTGMRIDDDGGVEFTIDRPDSHVQTLVITSQTLPGDAGATVDGAALGIQLVKGTARPCKVVDAPA